MIRTPALHFLAVGGLRFVLAALWSASEPVPARLAEPLVLRAADVQALADQWQRQTRLPLPPGALKAIVARHIEEELLYREARRLGLHHLDTAVRLRLLEKMEFLAAEGGVESLPPAQAAERAFELGLDQEDPVVRRTLVEKMKLLAGHPRDEAPPTEARLRAFHAAEAQRWPRPARIRFSQVFLSPPLHGDHLESNAATFARAIEGPRGEVRDAIKGGDAFPFATGLTDTDMTRIGQRFGSDFAAALVGLAADKWHGPIRSSYGLHFVWVEAIVPAGTQPFESVRTQVEHAFREDRAQHRLAEVLRTLRRLHGVRVEMPAETTDPVLPKAMDSE